MAQLYRSTSLNLAGLYGPLSVTVDQDQPQYSCWSNPTAACGRLPSLMTSHASLSLSL